MRLRRDTPLWRDPDTGERPKPDYFTKTLFANAVVAAGLLPENIGFRATPKLLRATGATLLLEGGVSPELVQRMGRWASIETLRKHYNRVRDVAKEEASRTLDANARAELGLAQVQPDALSAEDKVRFMSRRIEAMLMRVHELEEALVAAGAVMPTGPTPPMKKVGRFDDDSHLRQLITTLPSRKAILEALGVSLATKNYHRLEVRAADLDVSLPEKWQSLRKKAS